MLIVAGRPLIASTGGQVKRLAGEGEGFEDNLVMGKWLG